MNWQQIVQVAERIMRWASNPEGHSKRIGKMGWTIPAWATPGQIVHISELVTQEELDSYFLELYVEDSWAYGALRSGLFSNLKLERWHTLLEQAFEAFERGQHQLVIPALLTILDGLIHDLSGRFKNKSNVKQATKHKLDQSEGTWSRMTAASVHAFAAEIFARKSFRGERPPGINRNWILHGRDAAAWKKVDALRLFHAIQSISLLWQHKLS